MKVPYPPRWLGWLVFLCALAVFVYLLLRPQPVPTLFPNSHSFGHFTAFFILAILAYGAAQRIGPTYLALIALLIALAAGSEWLQGTDYLPLRQAKWSDFLVNLGGLLSGVGAVLILRSALRRVPWPQRRESG